MLRDRRGATLVEYALVSAGIVLVSLGAASLLSLKASEAITTNLASQPDAHPTDNAPLRGGAIVELRVDTDLNLDNPFDPDTFNELQPDLQAIDLRAGTSRLSTNFGVAQPELIQWIVPPSFVP